jgi:hypothetical protein
VIASRQSRQPVEGYFDIFDTGDDMTLASALEFQSFAGIRLAREAWHPACACRISENVMFRISTIDTERERRLVVEGTLVSPWVAELRSTWSSAGSSLEGRKLVIDLRNATTIDMEGEAAILELMKEGAKFCCSGVLTKHVLKQAAHRCKTSLENVLNRRD